MRYINPIIATPHGEEGRERERGEREGERERGGKGGREGERGGGEGREGGREKGRGGNDYMYIYCIFLQLTDSFPIHHHVRQEEI